MSLFQKVLSLVHYGRTLLKDSITFQSSCSIITSVIPLVKGLARETRPVWALRSRRPEEGNLRFCSTTESHSTSNNILIMLHMLKYGDDRGLFERVS